MVKGRRRRRAPLSRIYIMYMDYMYREYNVHWITKFDAQRPTAGVRRRIEHASVYTCAAHFLP